MANYGETDPVLFYKSESHKLHNAFLPKTGYTPAEGDLVKLTADGEIELAAADDNQKVIGQVVNTPLTTTPSSVLGKQEYTVMLRGYAIINAEAGADAVVPGPVRFLAYNGTTLKQEFIIATTLETQVGWALEAGDDGDSIKVLMKS